jgi:predicted kinase/mRNA-degrading endonuclease toxin of MazEF toxin-antitoxin module
MVKDFNKWNGLKQQINLRPRIPKNQVIDVDGLYVHPREIWWFSTGVNVGSEIDGKNNLFERPGIILKTHNQFTSTIIPISSNKPEAYYSYNFQFNNIEQSAILSQAKLIDHKRLTRKIGTLDEHSFQKLKSKFIEYYKYETPLARGISEAEAISSSSITPPQNLSTTLVEVIIGIGIPGSGKTTILKEIGSTKKYEYVCPDEIRKEMTGDEADQTKNTEVWRETFKRIEENILENKSLILDATNIDNLNRKKLLGFLSKFNNLKIKGILIRTDLDIAKKRNKKRDRIVPEFVLEKMYIELENNLAQILSDFDHMEIINNNVEN